MSKNHFYDNSTHIRYPDTIKVEEKRAPTDESVKLLKEMQEQTIQNLIVHVKVEDNLVNGECFAIHIPWDITGEKVRLFFKMKINGKDFTIERTVDRHELWQNEEEIGKIN